MRIGFIVSDLGMSGGVNVIVKHASYLATVCGHQVTIITQREHSVRYSWKELETESLNVTDIESAQKQEFDLVMATWWETIFNLFSISSYKYAWFCQSLEHRFYHADDPRRAVAQAAECIPIPCITESEWIQKHMLSVNPSRKVWLVRNGIDKSIFKLNDENEIGSSEAEQTLRILVEGNIEHPLKGIEDSLMGVLAASTPISVRHISSTDSKISDFRYTWVRGPLTFEAMADEYSRSDVLVKTSRVEGMFGPPLEAFHCGATAIVTPVTGHEEYIRHGFNSLVVEWNDIRSISSSLDRLNTDRKFLNSLKIGALATASRWPSWSDSSEQFHQALVDLCAITNLISNDDYRALVNGLRGTLVQAQRTRVMLLGFVKVADERFSIITSLERQLQSELPGSGRARRLKRMMHRIINRMFRLFHR